MRYNMYSDKYWLCALYGFLNQASGWAISKRNSPMHCVWPAHITNSFSANDVRGTNYSAITDVDFFPQVRKPQSPTRLNSRRPDLTSVRWWAWRWWYFDTSPPSSFRVLIAHENNVRNASLSPRSVHMWVLLGPSFKKTWIRMNRNHS
jgi:hypothetical protein